MPWVVMTQEEVKSVEVGQKIKVNGVETEVVKLYNRPHDYGFDTKDYVPTLNKLTPTMKLAAVWNCDTVAHEDVIGKYGYENIFEKYQE